jgi:hypothetical protein
MFVTAKIRALSWDRRIQFGHLRLRLPVSLSSSSFPTIILYAYFIFPHARYMPRPHHPSRFGHPNTIGRRVHLLIPSLRTFLHPLSRLIFLLGQHILRFQNPPMLLCPHTFHRAKFKIIKKISTPYIYM